MFKPIFEDIVGLSYGEFSLCEAPLSAPQPAAIIEMSNTIRAGRAYVELT